MIGEHDDGPWSKARAVHAADSSADVMVLHDADVWCAGLPAAIDAVRLGAPWAVPHGNVRRLSESATAAVLAGGPVKGKLDQRIHGGHAGGGITVVRRDVWDTCPLDPRFEGWGQEDDSWAIALDTLHGQPWRATVDLWHLWHPPAPRLTRAVGSDRGRELYGRYRQARSNRTAMADLVAEARLAFEGVAA
jgi:hypothetical protein